MNAEDDFCAQSSAILIAKIHSQLKQVIVLVPYFKIRPQLEKCGFVFARALSGFFRTFSPMLLHCIGGILFMEDEGRRCDIL